MSGSGAGIATNGAVAIVVGQPLTLRGAVSGTSMRCTVVGVGTASFGSLDIASGTHVTVGTLRIAARIDYVAFYALGE